MNTFRFGKEQKKFEAIKLWKRVMLKNEWFSRTEACVQASAELN